MGTRVRMPLARLRIENLAIVDHAEIEFGTGLTVFTGETGAGKSILVDAVSLVLGGRGDSELVRTGASEGVVEALIDLRDVASRRQDFEDAGISVPDGDVVIRRVISRSGKGRVLINGQMATVSMLGKLMQGFIDLSGQHEHVSLLKTERHLDFLDAFGGHAGLVSTVRDAHGRVVEGMRAVAACHFDPAEKARREDFLRYQIDEIASIAPQPHELDSLEAERKRLVNAEKLIDAAARAEGSLYSNDGAIVESLGRIHGELAQLRSIDPEMELLATGAKTALLEIEELSRALSRYVRAAQSDPDRLKVVEDRLEALRRIAKKHGGTIERALAKKEEMEAELDALDNAGEQERALAESLAHAQTEHRAACQTLSEARRRAAAQFQATVEAELASLSMAGTKVAIELVPIEPGAKGQERAEILVAPNVGEPMRPLERIASGGELSRILLSIKCVLHDRDAVMASVFDEIDGGLGGQAANVLGEKLASLSAQRQVVCITHLPQIAAYADAHFVVQKVLADGRTTSRAVLLDENGMCEELARMLGGEHVTDRTLALARELRARARGFDEQAAARARKPSATMNASTASRAPSRRRACN